MKPLLAPTNVRKLIQCTSNLVSLIYYLVIFHFSRELLISACAYLGNTLGQFRDKEEYGASKLLAYLPTMSPGGRKDVNSWFPSAKRAVIHHCIARILKVYRKDK